MEPQQVLPLRVWVNLEVIAIKGYPPSLDL